MGLYTYTVALGSATFLTSPIPVLLPALLTHRSLAGVAFPIILF